MTRRCIPPPPTSSVSGHSESVPSADDLGTVSAAPARSAVENDRRARDGLRERVAVAPLCVRFVHGSVLRMKRLVLHTEVQSLWLDRKAILRAGFAVVVWWDG
ncbi:hypothetical protein MRX96_041884 [Rhipicephalus microplus]